MDSSDKTITPKPQTIVFKSDEKQHCFETNGKDAIVIGSAENHNRGSSKVQLKNIVDYKWEVKQYRGRLIAVHRDTKHIAYIIKVNTRGTADGMVRVVNLESNKRALIKVWSTEVLDLKFAHMKSQILLACIEENALFVHKIESSSSELSCTMLLKIEDPLSGYVPKYDKINWCPYVPGGPEDVDEDASQLLVWVRGNIFQCLSVNTIIATYGIGTHSARKISEGCLKYKENATPITEATFASDGTTIAIGTEDGYIRFYQVYYHSNETNPRCLYQWKPHDGKPITSFFFLDNNTCYSSNLWKQAITGADNNTEIKVWCCESWQCTQTITFQAPSPTADLQFKVQIDLTSSYLVMSDMKNRRMYVLQVVKELDPEVNASSGTPTKILNTINGNKHSSGGSIETGEDVVRKLDDTSEPVEKCHVFVKSISEFPVSSPILSFDIVDAAVRRYKCAPTDAYLIDEMDDYDEDNNSLYCVVIRMYLVQPKSVQECHVLYQPMMTGSTEVLSSLCADSKEFKDELNATKTSDSLSKMELSASDENGRTIDDETLISFESLVKNISFESLDVSKNCSDSPKVAQVKVVGPPQTAQINLMTPDSFNSPPVSGKKTPEGVSDEVRSALLMLAGRTAAVPSPDKPKVVVPSSFDYPKHLIRRENFESTTEQTLRRSVEMQKPFIDLPQSELSEMMASGGSSPSREVQEIMSLKDTDCLSEFFDDEDDEVEVENMVHVKMLDMNLNDPVNVLDIESSAAMLQNLSAPLIRPTSKTDDERTLSAKKEWPKVPEPPIMIELACDNVDLANHRGTNSTDKELGHKIDQLIDVVQSQNCQISELRNQIYDLQKNQNDGAPKMGVFVTKLEMKLSKMIQEYLITYECQHSQKLEKFVTFIEKQNHELRENISASLNQLLFNTLVERLLAVFTAELQTRVLPLIIAKIDSIQKALLTDFAIKMAANDKSMRETFAKTYQNKALTESLGTSVVAGVQRSLKSTFVESLNSTLIPAYERTSQEMFKQIGDAFGEGTRSYMKQFNAYMTQVKPLQDRSDETLSAVHNMPEQVRLVNDKLIQTISTKIAADVNKDMKLIQANLLKALKDNIKNEIQKGFATQSASLEDSVLSAVRSQAQTPAPSVFDVQEQIKQLLNSGQINKAFHQALLANDLNLVEFTLDKADYKAVFNPCPLEQTVLLSLIQQISADMANHNELKQKYLSDALLNLNFRDPITKEHAPKVMRELHSNCQTFFNTTNSGPLHNNVRMLCMAIQGLGMKLT